MKRVMGIIVVLLIAFIGYRWYFYNLGIEIVSADIRTPAVNKAYMDLVFRNRDTNRTIEEIRFAVDLYDGERCVDSDYYRYDGKLMPEEKSSMKNYWETWLNGCRSDDITKMKIAIRSVTYIDGSKRKADDDRLLWKTYYVNR